jgi:exopolysaccharide biosynthesis polyprenyl glycosylphosphotransferase
VSSEPRGFDAVPAPELPKLEVVEDLATAMGASGSADAIVDLTLESDSATGAVEPVVVLEQLAVVEIDGVRPRSGFPGARWWQIAVKRAIDIVVSSVLLAILLPLLVLAAAAIGLTSRGPILFLQRRIGREGTPFGMLKFRSMRRDAHDGRDELAHLNEARGPVFKIRNDPRVTRVGRVIRRWSIDELPQLFNVLAGQMSLVGPRPPLPEEYSTYGPRERRRLHVKPGLTCIWQVSGRSELDFETWVDMDLDYISDWSVRLDLKLLAKTIPAVIRGQGAY